MANIVQFTLDVVNKGSVEVKRLADGLENLQRVGDRALGAVKTGMAATAAGAGALTAAAGAATVALVAVTREAVAYGGSGPKAALQAQSEVIPARLDL